MAQSHFQELLKALRLDTCTLVDIGARGDADPRWRMLGDRLALIGFEPDREECRRLNSASGGRSTFLPDALSDRPQEITWHLGRSPGTSSCYKPDPRFLSRFPDAARFDVMEERRLAARTLDEATAGRGPVDFIKLDTQGYEHKILSGGGERLAEAFGLEVEFSPLYEGQPLFSDVDAAVRKLGFALFDLRPCYWKRTTRPCRGAGQLIFADALYFKDPVASQVLPRNPAAALAICVLYGKFDYAVELALFLREREVYTGEEHSRIESLLRGVASPRVEWGKMRMAWRLVEPLQAVLDALRDAHWARYETWRF